MATQMNGGQQFLELLAALRSGDNAVRSSAEATYAQAQKAEPGQAMLHLLGCLDASVPGSEEHVRTQAATLFRRAAVHVGASQTTWDRTGAPVQEQCRAMLLKALHGEPSSQVRKVLVSCIAAVATASEECQWTELLPQVFVLVGAGSSVQHQESALRLLVELMGTTYTSGILARTAELGQLVSGGLAVPALRAAAVALVAEMVTVLDADMCQGMQPALPLIEEALKALADTDASALDDALQALITCASEKAVFFKPRFAEWAALMFTFADAKGRLEDGTRTLALEFAATLVESKAKAMLKAVPDFPQKALATSFRFLSEVEACDDERWAAIDEDLEEDDDDGLHHAGEAKVDFFVRKLGFSVTHQALAALMQQYSSSGRWQDRHAAAMAARASAEFLEEDRAADAVAAQLVGLLADGHMRVRHAAAFAVGQMCNDLDASFPARWHPRLIPALLQACADPVARVSAKAASSLEAVIGELDESVLAEYAERILEVFVGRLMATSHSGVLVAVMEALGALAAGLEGNFDGYYDQLMTLLQAFVARSDADPRLRGKAFECISLLGFAVGKERFAAAAQQTMAAMLAAGATKADDVQTECIREAMERMCKILGADFAPFVPTLLPGVLASLDIDTAVQLASEDVELADDDDAFVMPTENGFMKVNSGLIMEMLSIVGFLNVMIRQTGVAFFEFLRPTGQALAKMLGCTQEVLSVASNVRDAIYPCWAELVTVASASVPAKGQEAEALVVDLVRQFVDKVGADLAAADEPDDIAPMAGGIASVVRNAHAGCLEPAQVQGISSLALEGILKSLQRESALKAGNAGSATEQLQRQLGLPVGADEDDDDDEGEAGDLDLEETDERECRAGLSAILGACLKANPETYISQALPTLQPLMQQWLAPGSPGRLVGLHLACDLCEHLGERAAEAWPVIMEPLLEAAVSADAEERNIAAFALLMSAQLPQFGQQCGPRAFAALGKALQKKAKKSDEDSQRAFDNGVAALAQLCLSHPSACPDLDAAWRLVLAALPLKVDLDEGKKLHRKLFVEAQKPNGGALGSMVRVAQILGHLCEVYGRSEHMDEDLQSDLASSLAKLPQAALESLAGQFTAKQQKKVERIVADGQARK